MKALSPSRLVGRISSCSRVSSVRVDVFVTSTSGDAPDTVIVSARAPRFSTGSSLATNATVSRTLPPEILKAGQLIRDRIDANRQRDRRYSPSESVTAVTDGTCRSTSG
jgi:hypothetical protein